MARTRAIKPEFWDDEKLAKLSRDSRLTFIGMWSISDDYGVCKGNSVYLKNKIFPYDEIQVKQFEGWLAELENICVIKPFSHHDEKFFHIKNFHKHQKIDHPSITRNPEPPHEITEGTRETFGSVSRNTPDETEYKQKLETETEFKQKLETTIAASDKKTYRLPPKESDVPTGLPINTTPEAATGLPVETTQIALAEPPAQTTPGKLPELPVQARDELTEPSLGQKYGKKIYFDYEIVKFANVTDSHVSRWKEAYPAVDVLTELRQMEVWADTNRKNRKSDWQRFIVNWFKRSQDRARPISPSWKGGEFGRFGNSKPTHVGETEKLKGKYADQVDEVIYTDA